MPFLYKITRFLLDSILSSPLAATSPIGDAPIPFSVGVRAAAHDLDPEQPIGEVAVVEGESEIGFGGGGGGGIKVVCVGTQHVPKLIAWKFR